MKKTLRAGLAAVLALAGAGWAEPPSGAAVNGIGGFFFRAEDPAALAEWYLSNLGIDLAPRSYDAKPWVQTEGPTIFDPFPMGSKMFSEDKVFMVNFRTDDLDGLVAHLRANDVAVQVDGNTYPNGRFAQLDDPEGNPIQLWQPAAKAP
ncbi:MAG: VOC family protein [Pseudomonadota bacterium]